VDIEEAIFIGYIKNHTYFVSLCNDILYKNHACLSIANVILIICELLFLV